MAAPPPVSEPGIWGLPVPKMPPEQEDASHTAQGPHLALHRPFLNQALGRGSTWLSSAPLRGAGLCPLLDPAPPNPPNPPSTGLKTSI